MSEASSRLTVKVKLHPASVPAGSERLAPPPAPWSKTRVSLALLVLIGAGVAGYQFLRRPAPLPAADVTQTEPTRSAEPAVVTEPASPVVAPQVTAAEIPAAAEPVAGPPVADTATDRSVAVAAIPPAAAQPATAAGTSDVPAALPAGFSRIVLTDQMNNLQPGRAVGQQISFPQIKRLYLFTELKGYAGQVLRHRWYFGDTLHTDAVLTIEDSPWRTYSENWLLDDQRGPWRVEIVDQAQKVIFQYSFTYQ